VLDMGAGITMASGFWNAYIQDDVKKPIVATMGDSTFFHSGTTGLMNAVYNDSRFVLVILDNHITAMTGMQPAITQSKRVDGRKGNSIPLETIVKGCGVEYLKVVDPYDTKAMIKMVKDAAFMDQAIPEKFPVKVTDDCDECGFCHKRFECPALYVDVENEKTEINQTLCAQCGVCLNICPQGAIVRA